jgi:hypothetical protein
MIKIVAQYDIYPDCFSVASNDAAARAEHVIASDSEAILTKNYSDAAQQLKIYCGIPKFININNSFFNRFATGKFNRQ